MIDWWLFYYSEVNDLVTSLDVLDISKILLAFRSSFVAKNVYTQTGSVTKDWRNIMTVKAGRDRKRQENSGPCAMYDGRIWQERSNIDFVTAQVGRDAATRQW